MSAAPSGPSSGMHYDTRGGARFQVDGTDIFGAGAETIWTGGTPQLALYSSRRNYRRALGWLHIRITNNKCRILHYFLFWRASRKNPQNELLLASLLVFLPFASWYTGEHQYSSGSVCARGGEGGQQSRCWWSTLGCAFAAVVSRRLDFLEMEYQPCDSLLVWSP